eukprot:11184335-Lingulodinium_polyedra.AAC.1
MQRAQSPCHATPDTTDARPAHGGARNTHGKTMPNNPRKLQTQKNCFRANSRRFLAPDNSRQTPD